MKRFLPLLMLTGLLFGQDVLHLESGESYKGTYIGKVGKDIVFKVPVSSSALSPSWIEGITSTKKFPIWDVETIVPKNGEFSYPFDKPTRPVSRENLTNIVKQGYQELSPVPAIISIKAKKRKLLCFATGCVLIFIFLHSKGYHYGGY